MIISLLSIMRNNTAIIDSAVIKSEGPYLSWFDLQERFVNALKAFTKSDCIYLSRAIGIHERQVERWKYENVMPSDGYCVFATVEWAEKGKPIERVDADELVPWLD